MNRQFKLGDVSPYSYFLSISTLLGLMLTFVSPDDELPHGWLAHLAQWQIQTVGPTFLAVVIHRGIGGFFSNSPFTALACSGLITAALFSPIALLSDVLLASQALKYALHKEVLLEFLSIAPPIIIFWIAINLPFQLGWQLTHHSKELNRDLEQALELEQSPEHQEASKEKAPFIQQLPSSLGTDLIYIKSELHYLKVVTTKGSAMVLYSLSAAIDELAPTKKTGMNIDGLQVHRSFWVSVHHILDVRKRNREGLITMNNGDKIPVSRARLATVFARLPDR